MITSHFTESLAPSAGPQRELSQKVEDNSLIPLKENSYNSFPELSLETEINAISDICGIDLAERDVLFNLLSSCLPLTQAAEATHALLERYSSYAEALSASTAELLTIQPLGVRGAKLLTCIRTAATRMALVSLRKEPVLTNWKALKDYLNITHARQKKEHLRVLYLDNKNYLLADDFLVEGMLTWVPVPGREIIERAFQVGATGLIIVHNHPSGDPNPSEDDWKLTAELKEICHKLGISVHDHIIVGRGQMYSMNSGTII